MLDPTAINFDNGEFAEAKLDDIRALSDGERIDTIMMCVLTTAPNLGLTPKEMCTFLADAAPEAN